MHHSPVRDKIIKHLHGLNKLERQKGSEGIIDIISSRYDIPREMVEQVISEWSAGNGRDDDF